MTRSQFFRQLAAPIIGAAAAGVTLYGCSLHTGRRVYWRFPVPYYQDWWCISHSKYPQSQPMHDKWFREGLEKHVRIKWNEWGTCATLADPEGTLIGTPAPLISAEEMTTDSRGQILRVKMVTIDESGRMTIKNSRTPASIIKKSDGSWRIMQRP